MSKYGNVIYGGAKYGDTPKLTYSVEPMGLNVILFNEVYVSWQEPKGNFSRFRVVRNQSGYPETAEDGVIVYQISSIDGSSIEGSIPITLLKDGEDNVNNEGFIPIVPNRNVYYRVFLYTSENVWVKAGEIHGVVPKDTDVITKLLNLIPRTLTSDVLSPFGVIPTRNDLVKSDLYQFLDGLAFSYEQLLTEIDLIRPHHSVDPSNYETIPAESYSVGIEPEPNLPVINQRRLIRDANYLYSTKGTKLGVENYAEDLTGFIPTATVSSNLMLSVQDSTFYKEVGNWEATNATLSSVDTMVPDLTTTNQIDEVYTCEVVASDSGEMTLAADLPIQNGVPVEPSTEYTVSCKIKSPTSDGDITLSVQFFDRDGNSTSSYQDSSATSAVNSWSSISKTVTSDETSSYAVVKISYSDAGTYYIDQVCFQKGSSVSYDEARAITLFMDTLRVNYIENPSFEVDDSNWTKTNLTFQTDDSNVPSDGYAGSNSGKFTATSTTWELACTSQIPVESGKYFNVSMYSYSEDIFEMNMYVDVYDSSDNLIQTFEETHMMNDTWMRNHVLGLMSSETEPSYALVRFSGMSAIGDVMYIDMVQAEQTYYPTDYFDGSLPEDVGAIWSGADNASPTYLYPRRSIKIRRLAQTLTNWVPRNAWWRITTVAGLEYTNLDV